MGRSTIVFAAVLLLLSTALAVTSAANSSSSSSASRLVQKPRPVSNVQTNVVAPPPTSTTGAPPHRRAPLAASHVANVTVREPRQEQPLNVQTLTNNVVAPPMSTTGAPHGRPVPHVAHVKEPGQEEYKNLVRNNVYQLLDKILIEPLPASYFDTNEYRSSKEQHTFDAQQWSSELMFALVQGVRDGLPQVDQAELYRAVEAGSEQFSEVLYKTLAAANAAELALAAPIGGIKRALERRGYVFVDDLNNYRGMFGESQSSIWPVLQQAGNMLDMAKCIKDSATGHFDHLNIFEVVPLIGPMMTRIPMASIFINMFDKQIGPFKRMIYAASCVKELTDTHWGPNDDEKAPNTTVSFASAICGAADSANSLVNGAASLATGVAGTGLGMANSLLENTVGAVPLVGDSIIGIKHNAEEAASALVGNIVQAGKNATSSILSGATGAAKGAVGAAMSTARGALAATWFG